MSNKQTEELRTILLPLIVDKAKRDRAVGRIVQLFQPEPSPDTEQEAREKIVLERIRELFSDASKNYFPTLGACGVALNIFKSLGYQSEPSHDMEKLRERLGEMKLYHTEDGPDVCDIKEGHTHLLPHGIDKVLSSPEIQKWKKEAEEFELILAKLEDIRCCADGDYYSRITHLISELS